MSIAETYIEYVKNCTINHPDHSWNKIMLGFQANSILKKIAPNKEVTRGYQKLESMMMSFVANALMSKKKYVWGNIFAPCEIFESMGLGTLSIECLGCFLSGYNLEEYFIDYAQSMGIAPTLCSYHKNFIGAVCSGVVPLPSYAVTTSLACDGNLNTFRYLQKSHSVPFTLLDIPYTEDEASVSYVREQLESMISEVEKHTGKHFEEDRLRKVIEIENETIDQLKLYYRNMQIHFYPGDIIHQLYLIMAVHLKMGSQELLDVLKVMNREMETYPLFKGKRIMWVHLLPYYQETLKEYFNTSEKYQLFMTDMVLVNTRKLDTTDPLDALARKIIRNVFNGSYERKATFLSDLVKELKPDGVIHFCHWGCKQADGGSIMLKEAMNRLLVPMLILEGDGIDQRNSHDGQIKTRLEAFLEMLEEGNQ